ncbi:hypothetical protein TVAG_034480 [Trichomonas vaginalis G3]|uniref:Uncharacterized protein n=1 Tax=Trichomonas vaginalis (strain ATCC PRA-98 / G3) TaxID=412133 RepID=A2GL99_TRIV3|nr:pectin lyase-like family [Trichomonas vaginalis G3]EAX82068.1 hypothetical protein TVAG_034480 [Trichomonas vaginalis G3]KAI5498530.1 pectin lyase-like family [Trichomonas vaginalis G3]|eukprot:XP_001294998.1 hypothetical protein [Trichomonas vaginalis G3]
MFHESTPNSFVKKPIFKNNSCLQNAYFRGLLTTYHNSPNVTVSDCIFLENKVQYTFFAHNGLITVINCTGSDLTASTASDGAVNTDEMAADPFILRLELLSLGKCEAEYPFLFELVLIRSKKKKKS